VDLEEVADELYGLPPSRFVEVRSQRAAAAKADGDRDLAGAITGLRKPTASAWAVNLLVRGRRSDVDGLLDLGEQLRRAQAGLVGDELRQLTVQRRQVVAALARQARGDARAAGQPISEAAEDEVAATLLAALADPRVGDAVRGGRLTKAVEYSGVGSVDPDAVADAVAMVTGGVGVGVGAGLAAEGAAAGTSRAGRTSGGTTRSPTEKQAQDRERRERERAEQELQRRREEAAQRLASARGEHEELIAAAEAAQGAESQARAAEVAARGDVERLEQELEAARAGLTEARRSLSEAEKERRSASRHAELSALAVERAQAELQALSR
jgi:hypothetical protein